MTVASSARFTSGGSTAADGSFTSPGTFRRHRGDYDAGAIHMHLLEFVENSVDYQHFEHIHGSLRVPWTSIPVPGVTIEHQASWHRDDREPQVSWFENQAKLASEIGCPSGARTSASGHARSTAIVRFSLVATGRCISCGGGTRSSIRSARRVDAAGGSA